MTFFPARWTHAEHSAPDPGGWGAYVVGGIEIPEGGTPRRLASDAAVVGTDRATVVVPAMDAYPGVLVFEVRCELHDVRGGPALEELLQTCRVMVDGASPPRTGLLVGLELADGSRVRTYAAGPNDGPMRLRSRSGGASAAPDRPSVVRETYGVALVPDQPFDVVCSFTAVGIHEARVQVDPGRQT